MRGSPDAAWQLVAGVASSADTAGREPGFEAPITVTFIARNAAGARDLRLTLSAMFLGFLPATQSLGGAQRRYGDSHLRALPAGWLALLPIALQR